MHTPHRALQPKGIVRRPEGNFPSPDHLPPSQVYVMNPLSSAPYFMPRNSNIRPIQDSSRFEVINEDEGGNTGRASTRDATPVNQEEGLHPNDHLHPRNTAPPNPHLPPRPNPGAIQVSSFGQGRPTNNAPNPRPSARITQNPHAPPRGFPAAQGNNNRHLVQKHGPPTRAPVPALRAGSVAPRAPQNSANTNPPYHPPRQPPPGHRLQKAPIQPDVNERYRRESTQTSEPEAQDLALEVASTFSFAKTNHAKPQPFQPQTNMGQDQTEFSAIPPGFFDETSDDDQSGDVAREEAQGPARVKGDQHQPKPHNPAHTPSANALGKTCLPNKLITAQAQDIHIQPIRGNGNNIHRQAMQNSAFGALQAKQHQNALSTNQVASDQAEDVFGVRQSPSSVKTAIPNSSRGGSAITTKNTPKAVPQATRPVPQRAISPEVEEETDIREIYMEDFEFGEIEGGMFNDDELDFEAEIGGGKKRGREDGEFDEFVFDAIMERGNKANGEEEEVVPQVASSDTVEGDMSEKVAPPPVVEPLKPFMIQGPMSDFFDTVSAIDIKAIQLECMGRAKTFDLKMEWTHVDGLKVKYDGHFVAVKNNLDGFNKDVGGLEGTKDKVLDEKETLTRRYAVAGKQLAGQCNDLQGMTRSVKMGNKKRRTDGPSSQGTVVG